MSVPIGQRGMIHTWGRNDMATSQRMGFHWVVWAPYEGAPPPPVLNREDWTTFGVAPGDDEERMTPRFDLDVPGQWTVLMELLMNPDNPVVVSSYEGVLCIVAAPVYAGTIVRKELEYNETQETIPVY